MKIRSGILPRLKRLKLPEEFIVDDQNGCDVTLKLPEEFIMEDDRLRTAKLSDENLLFIFLYQQQSGGGLAPVLEDNVVGTGRHEDWQQFWRTTKEPENNKHSTFFEWTTNDERWAVVGVSTFLMVVS
ncbi:hypothetical protein HELRODRAFT_179815 [Helobdella robusta]|uniref:Uncharacterized protein n=1 Tax=Helobdella robusta TaxID=6412 RepID=T1FF65_HELRO|nr:hypothetical protein HELRODRAFT_179815 [Helobdella robusta]ESN94975.1 hypothetical protein HELRODRAFT_179815 [Helobdella robusta]